MSTSSSSSSSSPPPSSSSSSSSNGNGGGNYGARRRGGYDFEGPARIRPRRPVNEVWPEPFIEALAAQVAIDAARSNGRLAAAQAMANVFQVCSTWRAVSRSEPLWRRLTRTIWARTHLLHHTWHDEFIYRHRTALNFRTSAYSHHTLQFDPADVDDPNDPNALMCRCLALSDFHLACGFADGTVRLFDLTTRQHVRTFRPEHRDRLGAFSRAVSGIILSASHLVFASLDGDIHVAIIDGQIRRAHLGDVVNDGALVDFTGCSRWWVGLYAGVPGRAFHIWDATTEELTFVGGWLTDPEAVVGWHMLTELTDLVGRIRVTSQESAMACTSSRHVVFDLTNQGVVLDEENHRRGIIVGSFDVHNDAYITVDRRGWANVRRLNTRELISRFNVGPRRVIGCMNGGYAMMCAEGVIRVWEWDASQQGEYLYSYGERVGEVNSLVTDERHVAAVTVDTTIHLWDFGAE